MLHIFNTLSGHKQPFKPLHPGRIGLYVCGVTAYDLCHLGHARVFIVFDMVVRYLRASGYQVNYVRNLTDIDDKIIQRAQARGVEFTDITQQYIEAMHQDTAALGLLQPDSEPRATGHIQQIIDLTATLIDKDLAYAAANGDVYFRVRRFDRYGKLSGKSLDDLRVGARVEADEDKHDPLDFVLWKATKPGEPSWPSPWGRGRPGWHIECSAMSIACLGNHFDIHAGGVDLKFPHHENEIAQSEGATGQRFANFWMHNGHVQVDQEKMSKSLHNFLTLRDILEQDTNPKRMGEILRFMMLTSHYRSPLNYAHDSLDHARNALTRIYLTISRARAAQPATPHPPELPLATTLSQQFHACMQDDFNTPQAIAVLFELVRETNRALDQDQAAQATTLCDCLRHLALSLGLLSLDADEFLKAEPDDPLSQQVESLLAARRQARTAKNWPEADRIRNQLNQLGVVIEDKGDGTTWRKG